MSRRLIRCRPARRCAIRRSTFGTCVGVSRGAWMSCAASLSRCPIRLTLSTTPIVRGASQCGPSSTYRAWSFRACCLNRRRCRTRDAFTPPPSTYRTWAARYGPCWIPARLHGRSSTRACLSTRSCAQLWPSRRAACWPACASAQAGPCAWCRCR